MKKLLAILLSAWVVSGLAVLVLCALVWFFGPLAGYGITFPLEPTLPRVVLVCFIVAVWLALNWRRTAKARARERKMVASLAEASPPDPNQIASAEEVAVLGTRLRDALTTLRTTRQRRWYQPGTYLYDLPWYMFIGPPGAGKTTALINSGLNFPLADAKGPLKGVGGTRNCDWWFTDQAVLIDTAGRYTTQDSQEAVDKAAWEGFLALLKTHRRRQPINGVLVSISLSDLAVLSDGERLSHARAIKARLRELQTQFAVRFPVYVLFTKCDLVAGFTETFATLGKEEREQVWGMTFPLDDGSDKSGDEGGAVARFPEEFDLLVDRLNDRVLERMQAETDPGVRALIYGFPQQFASLRDVADGFLLEIFRPSRLEARPLLRGVYFTSGTQNGTPIDRLMNAMSGQFGLARQAAPKFSGAGKSFFLHRAIADVAFAEAGVVAVDAKLERRQRLLHRGAWIASAALLLLLIAGWSASYVANTGLIARIDAQADRYATQFAALGKSPADANDLVAVIPPLDTLAAMPAGYDERNEGQSLLAGLGLSQGGKLGTQAIAAYRRGLNNLLLPRLLARLETQLQGNLGDNEFLYRALKVYLILGRAGPLDAELVQQWVQADFANAFPAATANALDKHVAALVEQPVTAIPLNGTLIDRVRGILRQTPLAVRSYNRILGSQEARALPTWRYSDHAGAAASSVLMLRSGKSLDTELDGIFTFAGYHDVFAKLLPEVTDDIAEDSWVLGRQDRVSDPKQVAQLRLDVLGLYLDDYVRKWDQLIADLQIRPFKTMNEGLDELNTLSGPNSPFRAIFTAFNTETQLVVTSQADQLAEGAGKLAGVEARREMLTRATGRDRRIITMLGGVFVPGLKVVDPAQRVNDHFKWLATFVGTPEKPGPMEAVLAKMTQVYQSFSQVAASANAPQALLGQAANNSGSSLSTQLDTLGKSMPPAVQAMLKTVAQSSNGVTTSGAKQQIQDAWASKVLPLCQAALTNRYPLFQQSALDVPIDDFVKLMSPTGLIAQFFDDYLKPFVDTSQTPWKWNGADNSQLGLSANTLLQFQLASEIRSGLFSGSGGVSLKFEVSPTALDNAVSQVSLDVDGQDLTYAHGPIQPMRMQWPGPAGRNVVRLTFTPVAGAPATVTREGAWALFRLLDTGKPSSTQTDRVTYTFPGAGGTAAFLFTASSVVNAFTLPALHQFRCPATL